MASSSSRHREQLSPWDEILQVDATGRPKYSTILHELDLASIRLGCDPNEHPSRDPRGVERQSGCLDILVSGSQAFRHYRTTRFSNNPHTSNGTVSPTIIAWLLAGVSCVIVLFFLTQDFVSSRSSNVFSVALTKNETLELPTISACAPLANMPPFPKMSLHLINTSSKTDTLKATTYEGISLVTLYALSIQRRSSVSTTRWPDSLDQVTFAYRGPKGNFCREKFSKVDITSDRDLFDLEPYGPHAGSSVGSISQGSCQLCFQIGRKPKIVLEKSDNENEVTPNVKMHIVRALPWSDCQNYPVGFNLRHPVQKFLAKEIRRNWEALVERRILMPDGINHLDDKEFEKYVPTQEGVFNASTIFTKPYDLLRRVRSWEMLCTVYFYSGFFYPAKDPGVSYRLRRSTYEWERAGPGPYFTKFPFSSSNLTLGRVSIPERRGLHLPKLEPIYPHLPLDVYVEENSGEEETPLIVKGENGNAATVFRRISDTAKLIARLDSNTMTRFSLSRVKTNGNSSHKFLSSSAASADPTASTWNYESWIIQFDFSSHFVESFENQRVIPNVRFVADFLGYVSMAIGVSLFAVIKCPVNLFAFQFVKRHVS